MTEPTPEKNYKLTLNLPQTKFDMKANLTQREPAMLAQWQQENLYKKIRSRQHPKGKWVLHDGPPYANGDIHIGHLVNKVLKDIIVKFRTMEGYDSPYIPGWDCHGLPIESAIQKELGPKFRELAKGDLRQKCHDYAMKYVKLQGDSFQRLGVFGDFANPYLTLDKRYEAGILDVLTELVKRDLVYRQKKPVHWCTNDRTALAEAELEYANKKDNSIYVMFHLDILGLNDDDQAVTPIAKRFEKIADDNDNNLSVMIWTTTPWTLPANRAVAVHPEHEYSFVKFNLNGKKHCTLLARKLVEKVMNAAKVSDFELDATVFTGSELVKYGIAYQHPLDDNCPGQPILLADYVTLEDGTGLVHTAPGHGKEDYQTGLANGLEVYNPVLSDGRYDDTVPEFLRGKLIWDANQLVIDKLKETGVLFLHAEFNHEYPHCWRCKKPTIQRATEQWFVKASGGDLSPAQLTAALEKPTDDAGNYDETKEKASLWRNAVKFSYQTEFIPDWGRNRLQGMLATRPDWCISRQRSWGVPIPSFFDEKGRCLLTAQSVAHVAAYFKEHGADSWYTHTPEQILGATNLAALGFPSDVNTATLEKGMDILDVWFESGASHHAVLECTHPELGYPAAMYLEGSDQHRGWFQSSLLEASGYKSEPPFKQILTHGFVVDEKGLKYSKSSGNYVPLDRLLQQNGADVLRLWVASVDYQNDIKFGPALITTISEAYRKIRNTMRYLLGNLYDFNPATDSIAPRPHSIDAWMQSKVNTWAADIRKAYDKYEFHNVFKLLFEFCNVEISATYAKAIKDRLYCELPSSKKRRAAQTVCYRALVHLIELTAPILAYTTDESWNELRKLPGCSSLAPSVHLHTFSEIQTPDTKNASHWAMLMELIDKGNKQLDDLKRAVNLGNALDAEAVIILPNVQDEVTKLIADYAPEIEDALGVGFHRIEHGEIWDIKIEDTREKYPSCARSWKRRPDVGSDKDYPDLSARDAAVVKALRK